MLPTIKRQNAALRSHLAISAPEVKISDQIIRPEPNPRRSWSDISRHCDIGGGKLRIETNRLDDRLADAVSPSPHNTKEFPPAIIMSAAARIPRSSRAEADDHQQQCADRERKRKRLLRLSVPPARACRLAGALPGNTCCRQRDRAPEPEDRWPAQKLDQDPADQGPGRPIRPSSIEVKIATSAAASIFVNARDQLLGAAEISEARHPAKRRTAAAVSPR